MSVLYPLSVPPPPRAPAALPRHAHLLGHLRWRAWVPGVGDGQVVAVERTGRMVTAYHLHMDGGWMHVALPCDVHRVPGRSAHRHPAQEAPRCA